MEWQTLGLAAYMADGLKEQADVEPYGENTVVIVGPVDLFELAEYVDKQLATRIAKKFTELMGGE